MNDGTNQKVKMHTYEVSTLLKFVLRSIEFRWNLIFQYNILEDRTEIYEQSATEVIVNVLLWNFTNDSSISFEFSIAEYRNRKSVIIITLWYQHLPYFGISEGCWKVLSQQKISY